MDWNKEKPKRHMAHPFFCMRPSEDAKLWNAEDPRPGTETFRGTESWGQSSMSRGGSTNSWVLGSQACWREGPESTYTTTEKPLII